MRTVSDLDEDFRSEDMKKLDLMVDQVADLAKSVKELVERTPAGGQTQTVIHKTQGMSAWGAAAVVACFATWIALIVIALWESNLWAWKDIHDHRISVLEAKSK